MAGVITGGAPKAGRREWIGLAVIALPCLLYSMDLTVLNLAVPHLSADLRPSAAQLLWIVDIYGFMVAGSLITMGTLGGFAILTQVGRGAGLAVLVTGSVIYSLGICPVVILATDPIVGSAPVERAGTASAISEASSELGGALGIAILGSIGTAVYRGAMADAVPSGVPPGAMEAARSTLELAAGICAAMALAAAIIVAAAPRRTHPAAGPERGPELALESPPR